MKNIVWISASLLSLVGCTATQPKPDTTPNLSMANPASAYCQQQGGESVIQKTAEGEVGLCKLENGQIVDEWELFRKSRTNCVPEQAAKLVGQKNLTDAQIQEISKASIVRSVQPGQPVTMDYRVERITVTIDPVNKLITNASCG